MTGVGVTIFVVVVWGFVLLSSYGLIGSEAYSTEEEFTSDA